MTKVTNVHFLSLKLDYIGVTFPNSSEIKNLCEHILTLDRKNPHIWQRLASFEESNENYDVARSNFEKCCEIDPKYSIAHNKLALLLQTHFKEFDLAREHLEKCLVINPNDMNARQVINHIDRMSA